MKRNNSPIASGQEHLPLDLLRRYQQRALPAPEEHRVERHLLDCGLCSDILAGMETQSARQTAAAVQEINRRVAAAGNKAGAKVIPLFSRRNLAAAATLLLLLCAGVVVLRYNLQEIRQKQAPLAGTQSGPEAPARQPVLRPAPGTLADAGPAATPAPPAPAADQEANAAPPTHAPGTRPQTVLQQDASIASLGKGTPGRAGADSERLSAAETHAEQVADSARMTPPALAAAPAGPAAGPTMVVAAAPVSETDLKPAAGKESAVGAVLSGKAAGIQARKRSAVAPGHTVHGRVLDEQGLPLPGVSVVLKGSSLGTATDQDGKYSLTLPQNLAQADLTFAYIGFNTQEKKLELAGADPVNVTLAPNMMALNEVVVTGYGTSKEGEEAEITVAAGPQGGWNAFSKYLKAHTRESAAGAVASGRVVVGFTVQADGSLAGLRVLKSLSAEADAEALRLVQQYPGWQPARAGKQTRAQALRATVRFRGSR